jgi:hypothetical protein
MYIWRIDPNVLGPLRYGRLLWGVLACLVAATVAGSAWAGSDPSRDLVFLIVIVVVYAVVIAYLFRSMADRGIVFVRDDSGRLFRLKTYDRTMRSYLQDDGTQAVPLVAAGDGVAARAVKDTQFIARVLADPAAFRVECLEIVKVLSFDEVSRGRGIRVVAQVRRFGKGVGTGANIRVDMSAPGVVAAQPRQGDASVRTVPDDDLLRRSFIIHRIYEDQETLEAALRYRAR